MMKRLIFILSIALITFSACQKTTVVGLNPTQDQWGFVFEYTRVNCPTCGSMGGPLLHSLHASGNVVGIAAHVSGGQDPMETTLHNPVYQDRPHDGGIPFFWVGNASIARDEALAQTEMTALKAKIPEAGVDLDFTYDELGTTMTVKTKSKFFSDATGTYKISVFVLEDDIPGDVGAYDQSGAGAGYKHMCVLRDASLGSFYGDNLATDPLADTEVEHTYSFTLDAEWNKDNVYVAAVIWKYDPSSTTDPAHYFVNAKEFRMTPETP